MRYYNDSVSSAGTFCYSSTASVVMDHIRTEQLQYVAPVRAANPQAMFHLRLIIKEQCTVGHKLLEYVKVLAAICNCREFFLMKKTWYGVPLK